MGNRSNINLVGNSTQGMNVGGGDACVFKCKPTGNVLQFRSISATGTSIQIFQTDNEILISGKTGGGESYTFTNGLTETSGTVRLGGTLSTGTTINANNYNFCLYNANIISLSSTAVGQPVTITGYNLYLCGSNSGHLCTPQLLLQFGTTGCVCDTAGTPRGLRYGGNYRANFACNSLVDAAYVTGRTSGGTGGIAWNGSTANAVGTYGSASTIDAEANLTFDGTTLTVTGNVCGTACVKSPVLQLTTGAAAGCILVSNAAGCGVWTTPSSGSGDVIADTYTANDLAVWNSTAKHLCDTVGKLTFDGTTFALSPTNINVCTSTICLWCSTTSFCGIAGSGANGGSVTIGGGSSDNQTGGHVTLSAGNSTSGTDGYIYFKHGSNLYQQTGTVFSYLAVTSSGQVILSTPSGSGGGIGWSNLTNGSTVAGCGTVASGGTICQNTIFGVCAGDAITTARDNVAIGFRVLTTTTNSSGNTAIGISVLQANTTGAANIGIGYNPLYTNTCGCDNVAMGTCAMYKNISGSTNVAIGSGALLCNTIGCHNVAIGVRPLTQNVCGLHNVAIGYWALLNNTCGCYNVAIGCGTLDSNTTGSQNISIGNCTLQANTTNSNNIAMGTYSMYNTNSANNVAIGYGTLFCTTSGCENTVIGYNAGQCITTGCRNIAIGTHAGLSGLTGSRNVKIGYCAGLTSNASDKLFIANCGTCTLICGDFASKTVCIGGTITADDFILSSDERLKTNIQAISIAPVDIEYKQFEFISKPNELRYGVIAQELQQVNPELVTTDDSGMLGVSYTDLFVKEISFLKCEIVCLKCEIAELKNNL